jgi:hypothetical protein
MNYPMVSPDQLREILAGTPWYVVYVFDSDDTYVAIIEKFRPVRRSAFGVATTGTITVMSRMNPRSAPAFGGHS